MRPKTAIVTGAARSIGAAIAVRGRRTGFVTGQTLYVSGGPAS